MKTDEDFQQFKHQCKKILGYMPIEQSCVTCQTPDEEIPKGNKLPLRNCHIRRCVTRIGIKNCAYCSRFPCGAIRFLGTEWTREKIETKHGTPLSEKDYLTFVEPFEGLKHLKQINASLHPMDIVKAIMVAPLETKIVDFPQNLPSSDEETLTFKAVHKLLTTLKQSSLGLTDTDTFAQQERLKSRMPYFLRFLWIFSRYGEFKKENDAYLTVDAETYMTNRGSEKTLASWPFVESNILKILPEFGVHCKRVLLKGAKEKDLTTGTGYMRNKGWNMTISIDEAHGDAATLKALQTYAKKLDEKYNKKAFNYFSNVDMNVLKEK
jgi:hypothetical protein